MKIYNVEIITPKTTQAPDLRIEWLTARYRDAVSETDKILLTVL